MVHAETFTALEKKYEVVLELEQWYEVRCGGGIVWPASSWQLDPKTQIPITKNKLIDTQTQRNLPYSA
jgi:hypothetical protein